MSLAEMIKDRSLVLVASLRALALCTPACIDLCNGGGGPPYWIYLRKYCTPNDCTGWVKVRSDTAWGNGTTWGQSWRLPAGYSCPAIFKLGGVCYVVQCPGSGSVNCADDSIPTIADQGVGGRWFHWRDRTAACGPCCEDIRCVPRLWLSCVTGTQVYLCANLGREYRVNRRETSDRTVELTPAYLAFLNSGLAPQDQCWQTLEQHQHCNHLNSTDAVLRNNGPQGCPELTGVCNQDHYDFSQTALIRTECRYETTGDSSENCNGQEVGVPDASASAFFGGLGDACGFTVRVPNVSFLFDAAGCVKPSGTYSAQFPNSLSWFTVTWEFYEDAHVSRFAFDYEAHDYCGTVGTTQIECSVEKIRSEYLIQYTTIQPCQSDDESQCPAIGDSGSIRYVGVRRGNRLIATRQTIDDSLGGRPGTAWEMF